MWNIEFKGKIQGDINQISTQKPLPDGAVQFREPDSAGKAFVIGTLLILPVMVLISVLAIYRLMTIHGDVTKWGVSFGSFIFPFVICFVIALVSQYIHEYIHAFLIPKTIKKQIYVKPDDNMLFVYIEDPVPKKNFIISLLGPAIILGLIPYVIWFIIAPIFSPVISIAIFAYSFMMLLCAVGDYLNAFNCIRQVPKDGIILNRGWHSYWIQ